MNTIANGPQTLSDHIISELQRAILASGVSGKQYDPRRHYYTYQLPLESRRAMGRAFNQFKANVSTQGLDMDVLAEVTDYCSRPHFDENFKLVFGSGSMVDGLRALLEHYNTVIATIPAGQRVIARVELIANLGPNRHNKQIGYLWGYFPTLAAADLWLRGWFTDTMRTSGDSKRHRRYEQWSATVKNDYDEWSDRAAFGRAWVNEYTALTDYAAMPFDPQWRIN